MRREVSDLKLPFGEKDFVDAEKLTAPRVTAGLNNSLQIDSECVVVPFWPLIPTFNAIWRSLRPKPSLFGGCVVL